MKGLSFVVAALAAAQVSAEETDNGYYISEPQYMPHDPYFGSPVYDAPRYYGEPRYI